MRNFLHFSGLRPESARCGPDTSAKRVTVKVSDRSLAEAALALPRHLEELVLRCCRQVADSARDCSDYQSMQWKDTDTASFPVWQLAGPFGLGLYNCF